jgi:hypothetical protein
MKNIHIVKTLIVACLVLSAGFLASCDPEEETNNGQVALLSFGPTGAKHGETIKFIGLNLKKVDAIILPPALEIPASSFASHSQELIEIVIPEEAEAGKVVLRTPSGDIETKTNLSFEVPVEITSIPAEAKPGTNIVISGNFVNWIESVTFPEDVVVTQFVSKSLHEVVVAVPMEAKSGSLVFVTGGTEPLEIESDTDISLTLPAITDLAPNSIERGAQLTITGTNLDLVKQVKFQGNVTVSESAFVSKSETQIVVVFPQDANKGTVAVVSYSNVSVQSVEALALVGDLPPLAALAVPFYTDALASGFQKWGGWGGGSSDINSAENVRDGLKSVKVIFAGGWGGPFQLGGATVSTAGRTEFAISIFGGPGTAGKQVNLILKNGSTTKEKIITVVAGEWTEYKFTIAGDLGGLPAITELFLQDRDWSGTLFVDHFGLR